MTRIIAISKASRRLLFASILAALLPAGSAAGEGSLAELFQKGKTECKLGSYQSSLATFEKLDEMSRQPGNEASRVKLEPLIAFYRGANHAALGQKETARAEFQAYLASFPAAHLDPAAFPKSVIELFNAVKQQVRPEDSADSRRASEAGAIATDYSKFRTDPDAPLPVDGKWAEGALRFLMTSRERAEWDAMTDPQQRAEFITALWRHRDPDPVTPENEFRTEIERRIRYADARFAADEKSGSATDRGLVFVLMGPPSYIGEKPFRSDDDPVQSARSAPVRELTQNADGTVTTRFTPRTALTAQTIQGTREIWYYRRDRLPKVVKFTEVNFEFITRKGFGTGVLQRDHEILVTLDKVARSTQISQD